MQDVIRKEIIRVIDVNRSGIPNICEMDAIALHGGLETINIDAKIISGDLKIENSRDSKVIVEFKQGLNRQPIGHCWVLIKVESKEYFIDISAEAYGPGVTIFEPIGKLSLNEKIVFVKGDFTFEYFYKSDGCNFMP